MVNDDIGVPPDGRGEVGVDVEVEGEVPPLLGDGFVDDEVLGCFHDPGESEGEDGLGFVAYGLVLLDLIQELHELDGGGDILNGG